jgi:hypothetical protein
MVQQINLIMVIANFVATPVLVALIEATVDTLVPNLALQNAPTGVIMTV